MQDVNFLSFVLIFFLTSILNFFSRTGWVWVNIAFTFFRQLIFSLNIHTFIGRICNSINCILLLIFPFRCIIVAVAFFHFMLGYWFIYTIWIDYVIIISQGWCCSSKNYIVHTHTHVALSTIQSNIILNQESSNLCWHLFYCLSYYGCIKFWNLVLLISSIHIVLGSSSTSRIDWVAIVVASLGRFTDHAFGLDVHAQSFTAITFLLRTVADLSIVVDFSRIHDIMHTYLIF